MFYCNGYLNDSISHGQNIRSRIEENTNSGNPRQVTQGIQAVMFWREYFYEPDVERYDGKGCEGD